MSLLGALDNISNFLNIIGDKITGNVESKQYDTIDMQQKGLNELSNIVIQSNMESIDIDNDKINIDRRLCDVFMNKYKTTEDYCRYLNNWFKDTELFDVEIMDDRNSSFRVKSFPNDISKYTYRIFGVKQESYKDIINIISNSKNNSDDKIVIMGYINFDNHIKDLADRLRYELIGVKEIIEINESISLANKNLPYVSISRIGLKYLLAHELNVKYRNQGK